MPAPDQPTLLYPIGGEKIDSPSVNVTWEEPQSGSTPAFIEIRAAHGDDIFDDRRSYIIGRVPSNIGTFIWKVSPNFSGSDLRIAIRSVSIDGGRSAPSISQSAFSIVRASLPIPVLISPKPNDRISSSALIAFDDSPYSYYGNDRVQYYIYASSESASANYITIAENIPVGSPAISWNVDGLRNANDWYMNIFAADDSGTRSATINVGPLSLGNPGFIVIDTEPPDISVRVQDEEFYTKKRDISIKIYSSDEATGVHSMKIIEKSKVGSSYVDNLSSIPKSYASDVIFQLSDKDEKKYISVYAQDYGANRNDLSNIKDAFHSKQPNFFREMLKLSEYEFFRSYKYEDGKSKFFASIASSQSSKDIIVSVDKNGVTTLAISDDPVVALGIGDNSLYASLGTPDRSMDVRIISSGKLISKFSDNTFGTEVSAIGSDSFGNLFMGCIDGKIYKTSGAVPVLLSTLSGNVTSIVRGSSGMVFISAGNSNDIYIASATGVAPMEVTI